MLTLIFLNAFKSFYGNYNYNEYSLDFMQNSTTYLPIF